MIQTEGGNSPLLESNSSSWRLFLGPRARPCSSHVTRRAFPSPSRAPPRTCPHHVLHSVLHTPPMCPIMLPTTTACPIVLCARLSRALPGPRTVGCGWGEAMSSSSRPLNGMPGSRAEGQVQRSGWAAAFGTFLESPARGGWPGLSCAHGGERPDSGSQARGWRPSPGEGPGGSGVRTLESGCGGRALQPVLFPTSLRTRG